MKIQLSAVLDDATRKSIREAIMGEVKGFARESVQQILEKEVDRVSAALFERLKNYKNDWMAKSLVADVFRQVLASEWDKGVGEQIRRAIVDEIEARSYRIVDEAVTKLVRARVEAEVKEKLRTKTVWEAKSQDAYVREVVREELREKFK